MRARTKARECALKVLYQIDITGEDKDASLASYWDNHTEDESIRAFASSLVRGVADNLERLDGVISKYAQNWQIKRMAKIDRNVLRMAAFELLFLDDIPPKVSINEAIDIAKKYGDSESGRFVNGILDKISKSEDAVDK